MFTVLDKQFEYHFKSYSHHRARFAKISSSSVISSCSITELGYDWFSRARYWVLLLSCSLWGFLSRARFDIELALGTELGLLFDSLPSSVFHRARLRLSNLKERGLVPGHGREHGPSEKTKSRARDFYGA